MSPLPKNSPASSRTLLTPNTFIRRDLKYVKKGELEYRLVKPAKDKTSG